MDAPDSLAKGDSSSGHAPSHGRAIRRRASRTAECHWTSRLRPFPKRPLSLSPSGFLEQEIELPGRRILLNLPVPSLVVPLANELSKLRQFLGGKLVHGALDFSEAHSGKFRLRDGETQRALTMALKRLRYRIIADKGGHLDFKSAFLDHSPD